MENRSFAYKISRSFALFILLISSILIFIDREISTISSMATRVNDLRLPTAITSQGLLDKVYHSTTALENWVVLGDTQYRGELAKIWRQDIDPSISALKRLSLNWTNPENIERLDAIVADIQLLRNYQQQIEEIVHTAENRPAKKLLAENIEPQAHIIFDAVTEMIEVESTQGLSLDRKKLLKTMSDFRGSLSSAWIGIRTYMVSGETGDWQAFENLWKTNTSTFQALDKQAVLFNSEQKRAFSQIAKARESFNIQSGLLYKHRASEQSNIAAHWLITRVNPTVKRLEQITLAMINDQKALLENDHQSNLAEINFLKRVTLGLILLVLIATVAIGIYLLRLITIPIKQAVAVTSQIGEGDLDVATDIVGIAEMEVLSKSLTKMKNLFRQRTDDLEEQNWLKSEVAKVSGLTQGISDLQEVAQSVITYLCESIEAGHGVFYIKNEQGAEEEVFSLSLMGSYAFKERKNVSGQIKLGEGLVGQCAKEKKVILLSKVPADYIQINSGLGEKQPFNILVQPVLFEANELLGVIELAVFKPLSTRQQEMLSQVAANLGGTINSVKIQARTTKLLQESEERGVALKQSEERASSIFENSISSIITIDEKGRMDSFNTAAEKLFGYDRDEVIGQNVKMLMDSPHQQEHDGYLHAYRQTGNKKIIGLGREVEARRKDGSIVPVHLSIGEMMLDGKRYFIGTLQDISERKKTEALIQKQNEDLIAINEELEEQAQMLKQSEAELQAQSEELQQANEELEEKSEFLGRQKSDIEKQNRVLEISREQLRIKAEELALSSRYKSEFLANMSHELRTPLNSMLILSKSLADNREGNLSDEQVKSASVVYSGGQDLLELINDILNLSKVEAGKFTVHVENMDVSQLLQYLENTFLPIAEEKGLELLLEADKGLPETIATDVRCTQQILKNLLSNAIKFTAHGSVSLKVCPPGKDVVFQKDTLTQDASLAISVTDTGIGLAKDKQLAIFEAFQQADGSTSRQYGGTGLGLTISREFASLLGGEIQLQSEEGKGSTFTLYLPLQMEDASEEKQNPSNLFKDLSSAKQLPAHNKLVTQEVVYIPDDRKQLQPGDKSLLVIEDDKHFAESVLTIAKEKGFKCLVAGDASSGLHLAREYQPKGIILDLGLPDMDGLAVLDNLKADLKTRHIPVHIMSARNTTMASLQAGAAEFSIKPVTTENVNASLQKIEKALSNQTKKVLVVEDDNANRDAIIQLIENDQIEITGVADGQAAMAVLAKNKFDCIILDLSLPDMTGFELLKKFKQRKDLDIPPVIIHTGRELDEEEHKELQYNAQSIIVKGAVSPERLLDEVSLFLHSVADNLPEEQQAIIRLLHDPEEVLKNRKILLVDDDTRNTFALSKELREYGMNIILADNGQLALEQLAKTQGIDLVLMDIMMPVMDGYEAMLRIREQEQFNELPVIALTALAMPEDSKKCIEAGANDYLAKPIDMEKLIAMMQIWLFKSGVVERRSKDRPWTQQDTKQNDSISKQERTEVRSDS